MKIDDYKGEDVDDILLEKALLFYIQLEYPDADDMGSEAAKAKDILRKYGEQIQPLTLERMQKVFYSILLKYGTNRLNRAALYHALKWAWDGIGDWRA